MSSKFIFDQYSEVLSSYLPSYDYLTLTREEIFIC